MIFSNARERRNALTMGTKGKNNVGKLNCHQLPLSQTCQKTRPSIAKTAFSINMFIKVQTKDFRPGL
jgi:hypothetical protein